MKTKKHWGTISYFFFYLFLVSIPWQKRHIFFALPIQGVFNEWASISLFLSDILLVVFLVFWFLGFLGNHQKKNSFFKRLSVLWPMNLLLLFLLLWSLLAAKNITAPFLFWYQIAKLLLAFVSCLYIIAQINTAPKKILTYICIVATGTSQAIIAILQFLKQHSLGLKIIGENDLGPAILGVAKIVVNDEKIIRAYGTLPHPNILAGFLIPCIIFIFLLFGKIIRLKNLELKYSLIVISMIALALLGLAMILTFSRAAWVALAIILVIYFIKTFFQQKIKWIAIPFAALIIVTIFSFYYFQNEITSRQTVMDRAGDYALSNRIFLNRIALRVIANHPIIGIGKGNFVINIPDYTNLPLQTWQYQPVHNLYLAWATEGGIPALLIFLAIILMTLFKKKFKEDEHEDILKLKLILIAFIIIGFFDHYFYDLQQGILIFWLLVGLVWSQNFPKKIIKLV